VIARSSTLAVVVVGSVLLALVLRRRGGRVCVIDGSPPLTAAELATSLGTTATFVQFSSPTCAPCRSLRRLLGELTAGRPDLVHVELDVDDHGDLVRRHRVLTTPTVLVLDGSGQVFRRLSGMPDRRQLHELLAALPPSAPSPGLTRARQGAGHD